VIVSELLYKVKILAIHGSMDVAVKNVQIDSRRVEKGSAFIAIKGSLTDGHQFIDNVVASGAVLIVCESMPLQFQEGVTYVQTESTALAIGLIAANYFGHPSKDLKLVGVTGTNGKTTIANLLYKLFTRLGYTCGLISTVENNIAGNVLPATHTTPDALSLQRLLAEMKKSGCTHVFMEVSSHAIHQHRINEVHFSGGIFSNITHDHLDYHQTFDEYIRVKKSFFDSLSVNAFAISNADDKRGKVMLQNTAAKKTYYALKSAVEFKGKILENTLEGLQMQVAETEVHFRLIGEFNAYNLLAVYSAAIMLGEEKKEVLQVLSELTGAAGRFECFVSPKEHLLAIVDYAHTPDAVLNVLTTIKQLRNGNQKITTVLGCGGDRDKTKRPVMAVAALTHSDRVIFTSDNPRSEDPMQIIADMENGAAPADRRKYISIPSRTEAIKTAISLASPTDIILIAGKGHENYQEINGRKEHFDDREEVLNWFEKLNK
jgi:UDP-N-acetylmuramoyl-L-alanyl-D-glutamate--2,6-diaminopimelate ligase